jgi:signal transduction histidine kinase
VAFLPDAGREETATGRALTEELAQFAARAGHDLLGPLNQASSLIALFVMRYRNHLDAEADMLLDHLSGSARKMDGVVAGVGKYLEAAVRPLEIQKVDLQAALASALAAISPAVRASAAAITSGSLPEVDGDPEGITSILEILLDNAIKFHRPDSIPRIHVSAECQANEILIAVTDNGIGIDTKYSQEVFLPFRRLNGREYPDAGLGLSTARLIALLHGGSIRVSPASDQGTTVTLILPRR